MAGRPETLYFIWFIAACLLSVAVILTPAVILLLVWRNRRRTRRDQALARAAHDALRYQGDGTPYPPHGRGMCDQCSKACELVYHMPDARRLCPECFHAAEGHKHERPATADGSHSSSAGHNPETAKSHP